MWGRNGKRTAARQQHGCWDRLQMGFYVGKQWPRFLLLIEGEGSDNMVILFLLNCSYPKLYVIGISVLNWYLKIGI